MTEWENPIPDAALEAIAGGAAGTVAPKVCTCKKNKRTCSIHGSGSAIPNQMNSAGAGNGHENPMALGFNAAAMYGPAGQQGMR